MLPTANVKSSARDLFRAGHFLLIVLVLGLVSCSKETSPNPRPANPKPGELHEYLPTIALAMIPDAILQQQGVSNAEMSGWGFCSNTNKAKVAAYLLSHRDGCSFTEPTGNFVPVVWNHQQTHISLVPDPQQEERNLNTFGMMTKSFEVGVEVQDEDDHGYVHCAWPFGYGVHTKEPIGGSTDQGENLTYGGGYVRVGEPDMVPLFHCKDTTVWIFIALNRK